MDKSARYQFSSEIADFLLSEFYDAIGFRKDCVIATLKNIFSSVNACAALSDQDIARFNCLTAIALYAKALRL